MANHEDIFRIGTVSSIHPDRHKVRVKFADKDGLVSNELPVLIRGSLKNKMQYLPDVGELVLCAFLPNGEEEGFVLGAFYSEADLPLSADKEEYVLKHPRWRLHFSPQNQQDHSNDRQLRIQNDMGRRRYHL